MIMSLWHTDVIVSYIEALIDVRTLKKRCALFARKRSSRHKKFNSKQSSTWILATKYYICSSTSPWKKIFYWRTSLIIVYYITLLAKFGNCCSMVWAHRQGQWKGKNYTLSFSEEPERRLCVVLQCIFGCDFPSPWTTIVSGIENYPSTGMSCCSVDLAQLLLCLDL